MNKPSVLLAVSSFIALGCATPRASSPVTAVPAEAELADRVLVPGTGITFCPPQDSVLVPLGNVFLDAYRDLEIAASVLDDHSEQRDRYLATTLNLGEIVSEQPVQIGAIGASLVRDHFVRDGQAFDRWHLLAESNGRLMIVSARYPRERRADLASETRSSLLSVHWNSHAPIDPEAALGIRIAQLEGLEVDRSSSTGLVIRRIGDSTSSGVGEPMLVVRTAPTPLQSFEAHCDEVLSTLFEGDAEIADHILGGSFVGCEVVGTTRNQEQQDITTHLALLFRNGQALLLIGNVATADREPWIRRFRLAARSVFYHR